MQMNRVKSDYGTRRCDSHRNEFLLEVYRQTSTHLGRHVSGLWQCAGVVGAALIVFAQDKDKSMNDYACTLAVLLCGWLAATTLDAGNWFNRNLAIITNIERLFLHRSDLQDVHYFFERHRPAGKSATHFSIQLWLAAMVGVLVLTYHFLERVLPCVSQSPRVFEPSRALPYFASILLFLLLVVLQSHFRRKDEEFHRRSPGIPLHPAEGEGPATS